MKSNDLFAMLSLLPVRQRDLAVTLLKCAAIRAQDYDLAALCRTECKNICDHALHAGSNAVLDILAERKRQARLLTESKIKFDCACADVPCDKKLRVLVEEVGEVAKAIDDLETNLHTEQNRDRAVELIAHLKTEVTQVAAVATAWIESLP